MTSERDDKRGHRIYNLAIGAIALILYNIVWMATAPDGISWFIVYVIVYAVLVRPWTKEVVLYLDEVGALA